MNCGAKVFELWLRLELDRDRVCSGINDADPSGEEDLCRLCPPVVVEPGDISATEFGRPDPPYWDGRDIGDGDMGEDG